MKLRNLGNLLGLNAGTPPMDTVSDTLKLNPDTADGAQTPAITATQATVVDSGVSSGRPQAQDDQPPSSQDPVMDENPGAISFEASQLAEGDQQLGEFLKQCQGAYGVIVSSIDGNMVIHQISREIPVERLANMTSSLLALGETIARESLQRLCRFVILENSDGRVVCLRINRVLMLTCITSKRSNLGMVLNIGQRIADGLARVF